MGFYGMEDFLEFCRQRLAASYEELYGEEIKWTSVFVVWSCKTLQNYKALLSTPYMDGVYVEYTYNGDKRELYEDFYKKERNKKYVTREVME